MRLNIVLAYVQIHSQIWIYLQRLDNRLLEVRF